jgi:hypothetical protein
MATSTKKAAAPTPEPSATAPEPTRHAWSDPRYVEAHRKLMAIRTELGQVELQILDEMDRRQRHRAGVLRLAKAQALVDDTPMPRDEEFPTDLAPLREHQATLRVAEGLAARRLDEVEKAVSREIIDRVEPDYVAIVRRTHAAAVALAEALAAEEDFVNDLLENGTSLGKLQRINLMGIESFRQMIASEFGDRARLFYGLDLAPNPNAIPAPTPRAALRSPSVVQRSDPADWTAA